MRLHSTSKSAFSAQAGLLFLEGSEPSIAGIGQNRFVSRQKGAQAVLQVHISQKIGEKTALYFVPKAILGSKTLVSLGGGVNHQFNEDWAIMGDLQGPISGNNTFDLTKGIGIQSPVWGIAARYSPAIYKDKISLDVGVTNGLGRTTLYSAQPAVSGSTAFYIHFLYRN